VFGETLIAGRRDDDKIVAITAAMPGGHRGRQVRQGLSRPHLRCRHRRTARGHLCRRLATDGMKPFCAIYSTFLQRGYDQVVHDVAIQKLPVRFPIDRAGLSAPTAPPMPAVSTSPISACLPGFVVMAAGRRGRTGAHGAHRGGL
jgi:1-deoxy-D-xylulose-5-phosphate synthase